MKEGDQYHLLVVLFATEFSGCSILFKKFQLPSPKCTNIDAICDKLAIFSLIPFISAEAIAKKIALQIAGFMKKTNTEITLHAVNKKIMKGSKMK